MPRRERIATFDNDGTLWAEQPIYFQSRSRSTASRRWRRSIRNGRRSSRSRRCSRATCKALAATGEKGLLEIMAATHAGMTTEEFTKTVARLDRDARGIRASSGPTPSSSTSRCWSCSPICAPTASRPSSCRAAASSSCGRGPSRSTAFRPSRWSARPASSKFEMGADGKPVLVKEPKVEFIDDGPGKPVGINRFIGRRPIFAFGNSDGDLQMLQWTAAGDGARFMGIVHHTDAEREWAYDRKSHIGKLDKALDEAHAPKAGRSST